MKPTAKKFICALLAAVLATPAMAITDGDSPPITANKPEEKEIRPVEYMLKCPDLLSAKNFEAAILPQIQDAGQMAQLLYEYQIIFSKYFPQAVITALEEQGLQSPAKGLQVKADASEDLALGRKLKKYVLGLKKLALAPDSELRGLVWKIADHIAALEAEPGTPAARVRFTQVSRLTEALRESDKRELFEHVMISLLRESLVISAQQGITKVMSVWKPTFSFGVSTLYFFGMLTAIVVGLNYFGIDWNFIDRVRDHAMTLDGTTDYKVCDPYHYYANDCRHYTSIFRAYWNEYFWSHVGLTGIGFLSSALFGAISSNVVNPGNIHVEYRKKKLLRGLNSQLVTFPITEAAGRTIEKQAQSMWESMEGEVTNGVLSVEQACKEHICKLSPLQVAYLGHLDLLQLEEMRDTLRESLKESVIDSRVKSLREGAAALIQNESSYRAQMELKREIEFFIDDLKSLADSRKTAKDALLAKIDGVSQAMAMLKEKPYTDPIAKARNSDIAKNEMLIMKINSDLGGLQQLKVDVESLNAKVQSVLEILGQMETNLNELPKNAQGWHPVAERILLDLDRIPGAGQ